MDRSRLGFVPVRASTSLDGRPLLVELPGGGVVLIPTALPGGRTLTDAQALELFRKTGRTLGDFDTVENAEMAAKSLHEQRTREDRLIDRLNAR